MFKSNNTKTLAIGITAALTIFMITGPLAQTLGDNTAFAKSKDKGNESDQDRSGKQSSEQESMCVNGESIALSCNNLSAQDQSNDGHSASGQQNGGKGDSDGDQNNKQEQDSKQDSLCVSGEEAIVSCNNVEFQNLVNSGNSAIAKN
ncbi:MAG: hypothetical protein H0X50_00780 [Nitrosopumilus sp.]|nr:hypothetical protein [Nitrosopumilus sp.]